MTMEDIFCKIISSSIPADIVLQNADWIAINDIHPKAPVHVLIIPRRHLSSLADLDQQDPALATALLAAVGKVAKQKGIDQSGFRVIINQGEHGGQEVAHLHIHVLGGKSLGPKIVQE